MRFVESCWDLNLLQGITQGLDPTDVTYRHQDLVYALPHLSKGSWTIRLLHHYAPIRLGYPYCES